MEECEESLRTADYADFTDKLKEGTFATGVTDPGYSALRAESLNCPNASGKKQMRLREPNRPDFFQTEGKEGLVAISTEQTFVSFRPSSTSERFVEARTIRPIRLRLRQRLSRKRNNALRASRIVSSRLDSAHKYGQHSFVKTTLEIPESLFRKAKATAARQGRTLKQLVQEALSEKIARVNGTSSQQKPWMALAGGLKHLHSENRRIERVIEAEFENIEPEDRQ